MSSPSSPPIDLYSAYVDPCTDCANLSAVNNPVRRGGGFAFDSTSLPAAFRNFGVGRGGDIGLRCARTP